MGYKEYLGNLLRKNKSGIKYNSTPPVNCVNCKHLYQIEVDDFTSIDNHCSMNRSVPDIYEEKACTDFERRKCCDCEYYIAEDIQCCSASNVYFPKSPEEKCDIDIGDL